MTRLEQALSYTFKDHKLLEQALTHSSLATEQVVCNERLEFLGDRVLGLVIAETMIKTFPTEKEGSIAKRHALLVSKTTLAKVAKDLDLAKELRVLEDKYAKRHRKNDSILADACEAVLGAMYLDAGLETVREKILQFWEPYMKTLDSPPIDAKSALQEWAQGHGYALPVYEEVKREGPDHAPQFTLEVHVETLPVFSATGTSKKETEQKLASLALEYIEND